MAQAAKDKPPVEEPNAGIDTPEDAPAAPEPGPSLDELRALVREDVEQAVGAVMTSVLEKVQEELANRALAHELLEAAIKEIEKKVHQLGEQKVAGDSETLKERLDEAFQHIHVIRTTFERAIGHKVPDLSTPNTSEKIGAETAEGLPGVDPVDPEPAAA